MRTPVLVLALLVLLGAISMDLSSTGSEVKNKPKDEVMKDDIHNGQVMEGPDFDRKKKPGRKSGKKSKKKKGKKGKKGKKAGLFKKFKNTALSNFDSEIANLSCSNLEDFQSSHEGCGLITWLGCLNAGYKDWTSCEKTCDDEKLCTFSCVKKKIDQRTICKNCVKQLLKALCCHFIGGECCINADPEFSGDICCHIQSAVNWPDCSDGKPDCSVDHSCPPGEHCCPLWPPTPNKIGCCYNDTDECPRNEDDKSSSVLNIEHEDGRNITQNVIINHSSGLLTLESVTSDVLQKNVTRSTSILHAESNTTIIKSNSSCVLSDISHDTNVGEISQFFKELSEGTATLDVENKEVVHDIKIIKSIVGPEERKTLHSDMHNLCNDHVIEKTENKRIPKDEYEKLVNGEIIYLKDQVQNTRSSCEIHTTCSQRWTSASSNTGRYDPIQKKYVLREQVSSTAICFTCCVESADCNCTCPCEKIDQNQMIFEDCYIKDGNLDFDFQDTEVSQSTKQTASWTSLKTTGLRSEGSITNARALKIHVPPHEDVQETTVLMHSDQNGDFHNAENNMLVKVGPSCHIQTLPQDISPFEIALGMKHINAGNITNKPNVEKKKYTIIKNQGGFTANEAQSLNREIREICINANLIKYEEIDITDDQGQALNNGEVINVLSDIQTRSCKDTTVKADNETGCFRWENPDGEVIYVHNIIYKTRGVTCCWNNPLEYPWNCTCDTSKYCNCNEITDEHTLESCELKNRNVNLAIEGDVLQNFHYTRKQNETDDEYLTIKVLAHDNLEEATATMVMGIITDTSQRSGQEYLTRVLKTRSSCHILRSVWRWRCVYDYDFPWCRDPLKIAFNALKAEENLKESFNGLLTYNLEVNYTSVLVSKPGDIPLLPDYMDICDDMNLTEAYEVKIEYEQYNELEEGNIITLPISTPSKCTMQTKCASDTQDSGSGDMRWPTPYWCMDNYTDYYTYDYGTKAEPQCAVLGLVATPKCLSCCIEGKDQNYCECKIITDIYTFRKCHPDKAEMIVVVTGASNREHHSNVDFFFHNKSSEVPQLNALAADESSFFPVKTSGSVGAWINQSLIVCRGHGEVEDGCYIRQPDSSWEMSSVPILTDPLAYGGASAKYKSGITGNEEGETWWVIGGDPDGTTTQEWNSVQGANPWNPPVLPVAMNIPCMVSINDREIFVTSTPKSEHISKAWIFSRDYPEDEEWKAIPQLNEARTRPACSFLPDEDSGWIIVAGGYKKSSTEMLNVTHCKENDWNSDCKWIPGPDLGKDHFGATMVTSVTGTVVLFGDDEDILAMDSTFASWEVVGKMSLPRHTAVVLPIDVERDELLTN